MHKIIHSLFISEKISLFQKKKRDFWSKTDSNINFLIRICPFFESKTVKNESFSSLIHPLLAFSGAIRIKSVQKAVNQKCTKRYFESDRII